MLRFKFALGALVPILAAGLISCAPSGSAARADTMTLYIGGYTRNNPDKTAPAGICAATFDSQTGQLGAARVVGAATNPSWLELSPDAKTLYAIDEDSKGGVSAFSIGEKGDLTQLNSRPIEGGSPHISLDATGKWLAVASYGAGTLSLFSTQNDGKIGERKTLIQLEGSGPNANRQKSPHAHQAVFSPDNQKLWVADLGSDKVWIYDFEAQSGELKAATPPFVASAPGAGPRHIAFGENGRVYGINELDSTLMVFENAATSRALQTLSSLPADFAGQSTGAEVLVSRDGRFVYASNRGAKGAPSTLGTFAVGAEGKLTPVGWVETPREPRHFTLSPDGKWLLAANQQTRAISVYAIDSKSGELKLHSKLEGVPMEPTCLVWGK